MVVRQNGTMYRDVCPRVDVPMLLIIKSSNITNLWSLRYMTGHDFGSKLRIPERDNRYTSMHYIYPMSSEWRVDLSWHGTV
jgi:hypothetical protein